MQSIVGIFNSLADARRARAILNSLEIAEDKIAVLSPHTSEAEIEARVPISESEQPGMGQAVGGTVGAALGVAGGASAGAVAATILVPGVGPVLALGLLGAAIFGVGGAAAGVMAGNAFEKAIDQGLPRDELYVYEDALRRGRSIVIAFADDEQAIEPGHIYVAPPDCHMLIERDRIRLDRGPKVHYTRPAADPLFVSAATAYGEHVIGVVLSGADSDGAAGLRAIKARGGVALVQRPEEATIPSIALRSYRSGSPG